MELGLGTFNQLVLRNDGAVLGTKIPTELLIGEGVPFAFNITQQSPLILEFGGSVFGSSRSGTGRLSARFWSPAAHHHRRPGTFEWRAQNQAVREDTGLRSDAATILRQTLM